jgi:hypothetical protein
MLAHFRFFVPSPCESEQGLTALILHKVVARKSRTNCRAIEFFFCPQPQKRAFWFRPKKKAELSFSFFSSG